MCLEKIGGTIHLTTFTLKDSKTEARSSISRATLKTLKGGPTRTLSMGNLGSPSHWEMYRQSKFQFKHPR